MSGYTKLFPSILDSTVWHTPLATKVVWITLLAMADRDGIAEASVPGLARRAGVTREQCEDALACFLAPDPDSRTKDHDGRRIVEVDGGWRLLNSEKYREKASADERREKDAARQQRKRDLDASRDASRSVTPHHASVTPRPSESTESRHAEAEATPSATAAASEREDVGLASSAPPAAKALTLALVEPPTKTPAQVVFDRWLEVTGRTRRTEFSDERRRLIEKALKTYGLDDVMTALLGLSRSDWNMGRDPKSGGAKYDDLELVFRNATKFERFRDMGTGEPPRPLSKDGPQPPSDASKFRPMSREERRARMTGGAS